MEINAGNNSIGLFGATFLVLLVLKLCGIAEISWFWVFLPLWTPIVLVLLIVAVYFAFYLMRE